MSGHLYKAEEKFEDDFGTVIVNLHSPEDCKAQENCVIHNPSDHSMSDFPILWRPDRHIFERICPHGIGHPDPDDLAYQVKARGTYMSVHGCDGCCDPLRSCLNSDA